MNKIRVCFAGDFCPDSEYERLILEIGEKIFADILEITTSADLSILNFECPTAKDLNKINKDGPNLKTNINDLSFLKRAGFDLVNVANNHIMDYGLTGLLRTLEKCNQAELENVGYRLSSKIEKAFYVKYVNNLSVAVIAVAEKEFNTDKDNNGVVNFDLIEITKLILNLRSKVDVIILSYHGGNEFYPYPRPGLRKQCKYLVDIGVDAVVCHHVHVPGAIEFYNDKPIIYSLGNFVYDHSKPPSGWKYGYLADFLFEVKDSDVSVQLNIHPYVQSSSIGGVKLLTGTEKEDFLVCQSIRNKTLQDENLYKKVWDEYVDEKSSSYISWNYSPLGFKGLGRLSKLFGLDKIFLNKFNYKTKYNYMACDSHRELLTAIINKKIKDFSGT